MIDASNLPGMREREKGTPEVLDSAKAVSNSSMPNVEKSVTQQYPSKKIVIYDGRYIVKGL